MPADVGLDPRPWGGAVRPLPEAAKACSPYGAIVHHIRENLERRIAVEELAGVARLSIFQLSRALRRDHAMTPYRFVVGVRIEVAKDRLRAGLPIAEAAFQSGFADQSHLTRHFKRLTGMTPKTYLGTVARPGPES